MSTGSESGIEKMEERRKEGRGEERSAVWRERERERAETAHNRLPTSPHLSSSVSHGNFPLSFAIHPELVQYMAYSLIL
jgi:hypothetical protein